MSLGSSITIGITSVPMNLDPFFATDANSQNINRLSHLALIDFDEKMSLECQACASYKEYINKDNHRINIKLKRDLKILGRFELIK